ncbi:MAG TPA: hypothetical protein VFI62_14090, partial [Burkholderiales bacterium]|nr:hypothetical protein [Burkholderiales bacterium]
EDAFEAAVCLFICGDIANSVHVCRTYAWRKNWALQISGALSGMLVGGNDAGALSLARVAIADAQAPADASAIYLLLLQKQNLLAEATAYVNRWRDPPAGETFLLTLLAEVAVAKEDWRQAYRYACAVLAADPDDIRALLALSLANYHDGNYQEALGSARRAHAIDEGSPAAILQIMRCHNKLGDYYGVPAAFNLLAEQSAIAPDFHIELGKAYSGLEQPARAIEAYKAALATDASSVEAIRELVKISAFEGDAVNMERLVTDYPAQIHGDVDCLYWWGLERMRRGDLASASRRFSESTALARSRGDDIDSVQWPVPEPRLRHDYEQLELLERRGKLDSTGRDALKVLRPYYEKSGDVRITFAPEGVNAAALKRALGTHYDVPAVPFSAKTLGENDYAALEDAYFSKRLVVIDNFLSDEALVALRTFCEEATVWKNYNRHGYVGALLASGFASPVLLELADELRHAMPRVIGDLPLLQAWGFKYDQRMQGINMHADFAKVNVNFWITPDAACADPTSGGMVVYDMPVPKSWTFADYNTDPERLAAYVKLHNAQPLRVTYRENRCVVFDSSLIHVTDRLHFKPGYENRRVNVTLLYGKGLSVE